MSAADMKKPPVAPKPKHVFGQKPSPPPVAPKPDLVVSNNVQASKKSKPTIAPKPKVLRGSSVPEDRLQRTVKYCSKSTEENKGNCPGTLRCKNETSNDTESSSYIISICSCTCDCTHKLGNGEHCKNPQKVIEMLGNLENKKMCGQPAPSARTRRKACSQQVKLGKDNQITLRSSNLEDKINHVLTSNGSAFKHENSENVKAVTHRPSKDKMQSNCSEGSFSDGYTCSVNQQNNLNADMSPPPVPHGGFVYHSDSEKMDNERKNNGILPPNTKLTREGHKKIVLQQRSLPPQKVLPVPKPRRLKTPCLVRQDCFERSTEGNEAYIPSRDESTESTKRGLNGLDCPKKHLELEKTGSDSQNNINGPSQPSENCEMENGELCEKSCLESEMPHETMSNNSSKPDLEEENIFRRCSSLSMSLPKQLRLIYEQQLPVKKTCDIATEKTNVQAENSPKVAPKKPQRHSLPPSVLLKKAASEENLQDCNDEKPSRANSEFQSTYHRHLLANGEGLSSSLNIPRLPSEKPAWKLPHPILPFSGSPESLKGYSNSETVSPVTKPRAKSLSSVDMDIINKPAKENTKRSPLKKLLNMKLSVCIIKSDFQKFLSRSCQSSDSTSCDIVSYKENASSPVMDKKSKPTKAHSADCSSPPQKKWQKQGIDVNVASTSKDDGFATKQMPMQTTSTDLTHEDLPGYENICHYEEIPEYENLPFTLLSDQSDCDATIYEVEDPNEVSSAINSHVYHSEPSQEDPDDELGIIHSDDEEIINSSDEDDFSSDSSKTDLDHAEYKPKKKTGRKPKVYHIAKEIMSSEKVFVDVLKLLHIDFRNSVAQTARNLGKQVIEDKILNQILYYLPQLYELNRDVLRELEERMSQWSEHQKIADIFVKKGPYLKMYSTYIREFDRNVTLLDEQCKKNPGFAAIVKDFEMSPRAANLAIKHYLLKPVQRIPQYKLLLTDYLKNLSEDSSDYNDTQAALSVVIEVANHANDILKQGDNFQKLMQIQYSLSGHHEIVQPGRVFLKEGTLMKLSRKVMQPRMFFLFNDALLYTTPVQSGMYKLNNMLSLAGMKVGKPTQEAYQNELNIESVERSFILSASSATERDDWLEAISRAIEEHTKKKITFNPAKSQEEADLEEKGDWGVLGSKAPIWIPDGRATMCMICTSEFTLTWRRHHCRACGKIICQACSTNKHSLEYMKKHLARVCDHCFQNLQKQDSQSTPNTSPANQKSTSTTLSSVLHSIPSGRKQKKIPAALKVSASTEDSSMSGYLQRSKGNKKPWKQLWFVIKNKVLYTYAASEDIAALESQPLLGFTIKVVNDENAESNVIQLLHKNNLFYIFRADDTHTTQRWIEAFQEGTVL
ncbi:FYVE, and PH domain-containing 6 [Pelobates cultripes]|uniref:FYVE, and PH domain-containing 6 n=1 Tax=Pelobates cultripes TaxID=61616 RepID=A0AAD1RWQ9_PELCU|nr:FYVE, and PH domain-containing 6 [Pelobates cultripes]